MSQSGEFSSAISLLQRADRLHPEEKDKDGLYTKTLAIAEKQEAIWEELQRVIHEGDRSMRAHDYQAAALIYETALAAVPDSMNTIGLRKLQDTFKMARDAQSQAQLARAVI